MGGFLLEGVEFLNRVSVRFRVDGNLRLQKCREDDSFDRREKNMKNVYMLISENNSRNAFL